MTVSLGLDISSGICGCPAYTQKHEAVREDTSYGESMCCAFPSPVDSIKKVQSVRGNEARNRTGTPLCLSSVLYGDGPAAAFQLLDGTRHFESTHGGMRREAGGNDAQHIIFQEGTFLSSLARLGLL